jgi:hypothetical protein
LKVQSRVGIESHRRWTNEHHPRSDGLQPSSDATSGDRPTTARTTLRLYGKPPTLHRLMLASGLVLACENESTAQRKASNVISFVCLGSSIVAGAQHLAFLMSRRIRGPALSLNPRYSPRGKDRQSLAKDRRRGAAKDRRGRVAQVVIIRSGEPFSWLRQIVHASSRRRTCKKLLQS